MAKQTIQKVAQTNFGNGSSLAALTGNPAIARSLPRILTIVALIVLFGLALGARLYKLDYQSLWLDEAVSLDRAKHDVAFIWDESMSGRDQNPPLYFLALHYWHQYIDPNEGEADIRLPSVIAGMIGVAALSALGWMMYGRSVGLIVGLIGALNPFLVWYSQEARSYAFSFCFATLTLLCLLIAWKSQLRWWWVLAWIGFLLFGLAGLYSHFFGVFVVGFAPLLGLLVGWRRWWNWIALAATLGISGWLYMPVVKTALSLSGSSVTWRRFVELPESARRLVSAFAYRKLNIPEEPALYLIFCGILALAILWAVVALFWKKPVDAGAQMHPSAASLFLVLYLVVPVIVVYILSLKLPLYEERYFIVFAPAFYLLIAEAIAVTWRRIPIIGPILGISGLIFVTIVSLITIDLNTWNPDYKKEDFRAMARYIAAQAAPGDAVVILAAYSSIPFDYYYHSQFQGQGEVIPYGSDPTNPAQVVESMTRIAQQHSRVWLVLSHDEFADPAHNVESWLGAQFPSIGGEQVAFVRAAGFATRSTFEQLPPEVVPVNRQFQSQDRSQAVVLGGYDLYPANLPAGEPVHLSMYLRRDGTNPLPDTLRPQIDVLNAQGMAMSHAGESSVLKKYPPSQWPADMWIRDEYDIQLSDLPQGHYTIRVGFPGWSDPLILDKGVEIK